MNDQTSMLRIMYSLTSDGVPPDNLKGLEPSPMESFAAQGLFFVYLAHALGHLFGLIRLFRAAFVCACCSCDDGCCCARLSPRAKLRRVWAVVRVLSFVYGLLAVYLFGTSPARSAAQGTTVVAPSLADVYEDDSIASTVVLAIVSLACAFWPSPQRRGRVTRFLSTLGQRSSKSGIDDQHQAAAVASLLGGRNVETALAAAGSKFRVLSLDQLDESDMATSNDTGLYKKTTAAELGTADAFVSHSWRDDGKSKYAALLEWASSFVELERAPLLWLDKACIDQSNIDASLAALPIFLAGCKKLLVVAGPSYTQRLWCVMELFTFVRMGGTRERIEQRRIDGAAGTFESFDANRAQCFLHRDREKLLAVIESTFGDLHPFNQVVRGLLVEPSWATSKAGGAKALSSSHSIGTHSVVV